MQTIRRLYFYIISFLSLEVFLWGFILLIRNTLEMLPTTGSLQPLAEGLAMVCTGIPIFWLHWHIAQRDARQNPEEKNSRLRAFFLYGLRLATLVPIVQNVLAILNRLALQLLAESNTPALVGSNQNLGDNITAIAINLIAWNLFESVLNKNWRQEHAPEALSEIRRLFRYIWLFYSLGLSISGLYQIIHFLLELPGGMEKMPMTQLANGLAMLIVGAPICGFIWQIIQVNLFQNEERQSILRLIIFYLLTFIGAGISLISAVIILDQTMNWLLGAPTSLPSYLKNISGAVGLLVPFSILWSFYLRALRDRINIEEEQQQKSALQIYDFVLTLFGNIAVFLGLRYLSAALAEDLFGNWFDTALLRMPIGTGLASLVVGLPFWLPHWLRLEKQAKDPEAEGGLARRALVRKGYLYIILLLCVAGGMTNTIQIFQQVFTNLFGVIQPDFAPLLARHLLSFTLFLAWGLYHLHVLQRDGKLAQKALEKQHLRMLTLIFKTGENDPFAELTANALQNRAPNIPCFIHQMGKDIFSDLVETRICVLSMDLALNPPNALRLWLQDFKGQQIIIPSDANNIVLVGDMSRSMRETAEETARLICQFAEGQSARSRVRVNAWTILAYIFASIFGVLLLAVALSALFTLFD